MRRGAEASRITATIVTAMNATTSHPTGRAFAMPASSRSSPSPATASIHQPVPRIRRRWASESSRPASTSRRSVAASASATQWLFAIHLRWMGVATAAWTARSSSSCPASERGTACALPRSDQIDPRSRSAVSAETSASSAPPLR